MTTPKRFVVCVASCSRGDHMPHFVIGGRASCLPKDMCLTPSTTTLTQRASAPGGHQSANVTVVDAILHESPTGRGSTGTSTMHSTRPP
jgi:hypothetical protein